MNELEEIRDRIAQEASVREKIDEQGNKWKKIYFGGGAHFKNWFEQALELYGEENLQVEEADSKGFQCYEQGGEKIHRIWVKEGACDALDSIYDLLEDDK